MFPEGAYVELERLKEAGFEFKHPEIEGALRSVLGE
ncbi:MAG: DUF1731 domain-containing protein [Acidobacteria bacterium]|nr:DUF1731 domain-containing protein [Acidobacteriota bacterium]